VHSIGQLTNTRCSDGVPEPDGTLRTVTWKKILQYRQLYIDHPKPIAFLAVALDTSVCIYDDFSCLLFLHAHREASALANKIPEESGQFRFLRAACLANIKGSVFAQCSVTGEGGECSVISTLYSSVSVASNTDIPR
jgi:hypothetical protein